MVSRLTVALKVDSERSNNQLLDIGISKSLGASLALRLSITGKSR